MSKLCETLLICEILLECSVAAPKKEENEKKLKSEATIKKDFEVFFFCLCVSVRVRLSGGTSCFYASHYLAVVDIYTRCTTQSL